VIQLLPVIKLIVVVLPFNLSEYGREDVNEDSVLSLPIEEEKEP
jgi:hypothetical protein